MGEREKREEGGRKGEREKREEGGREKREREEERQVYIYVKHDT